ncbi:MAG: hypothetical protein V4488_06915 [Pseudomonadota bacterium]
MKISCIVIGLCACSAISFTSLARAGEAETSLTFVKGLGINANFGQMVRFGAVRMQTYRNVVCIVGSSDAKQLVEQELLPAIAKYQPQWDKNLAAVWMQLLTEVEMQSLLDLKRQSPYVSKYQVAGPKAGAAMMSSSSDILQNALSEGMNRAWSKASAEHSVNPAVPCKS